MRAQVLRIPRGRSHCSARDPLRTVRATGMDIGLRLADSTADGIFLPCTTDKDAKCYMKRGASVIGTSDTGTRDIGG